MKVHASVLLEVGDQLDCDHAQKTWNLGIAFEGDDLYFNCLECGKRSKPFRFRNPPFSWRLKLEDPTPEQLRPRSVKHSREITPYDRVWLKRLGVVWPEA